MPPTAKRGSPFATFSTRSPPDRRPCITFQQTPLSANQILKVMIEKEILVKEPYLSCLFTAMVWAAKDKTFGLI